MHDTRGSGSSEVSTPLRSERALLLSAKRKVDDGQVGDGEGVASLSPLFSGAGSLVPVAEAFLCSLTEQHLHRL